MLDLPLRAWKDRALEPITNAARRGQLSPYLFTTASLVLCVGAGALAWRGWAVLATASWLIGRLLDGLDGALARANQTDSDLGGFVDFVGDTMGYAAVPLGIAFGAGDVTTWRVTAVLIATFYVNAVSLLMLSALLEKRAAGAVAHGETTSVTMPNALIEGTETIILFTIALAVPATAQAVFVIMAIGVTISVAQRAAAARRLLG